MFRARQLAEEDEYRGTEEQMLMQRRGSRAFISALYDRLSTIWNSDCLSHFSDSVSSNAKKKELAVCIGDRAHWQGDAIEALLRRSVDFRLVSVFMRMMAKFQYISICYQDLSDDMWEH